MIKRTQMKQDIHALHGFLGLPTDWDVFNLSNLHAYDLLNPTIDPTTEGFWTWANRFNNSTKSHGILMGYSLGGRLAMHALLENPTKWKAGIIISSHVGFKTEKEKISRVQADSAWAERFEKEPWEKVLHDWNAQSVFGGVDFPLLRHENQFSRKHLADLLRVCSRGYQDDLLHAIQNFQRPILWMGGKLDPNFVRAAKELHFAHPLSRVEIIEDAAHRVPWEQPEKFLKTIQSFIDEVS